MTCEEYRRLVYLEEEIPDAVLIEMVKHGETCKECRKEWVKSLRKDFPGIPLVNLPCAEVQRWLTEDRSPSGENFMEFRDVLVHLDRCSTCLQNEAVLEGLKEYCAALSEIARHLEP